MVMTQNINKNTDFACYQLLVSEFKQKTNFNDSLFNQFYESYHLDKHYKMSSNEFKQKIEEISIEARNNYKKDTIIFNKNNQ